MLRNWPAVTLLITGSHRWNLNIHPPPSPPHRYGPWSIQDRLIDQLYICSGQVRAESSIEIYFSCSRQWWEPGLVVTLDQTEITLLALWEHRGTKARVTVKKSNILLSNLSFLSERERGVRLARPEVKWWTRSRLGLTKYPTVVVCEGHTWLQSPVRQLSSSDLFQTRHYSRRWRAICETFNLLKLNIKKSAKNGKNEYFCTPTVKQKEFKWSAKSERKTPKGKFREKKSPRVQNFRHAVRW